MVYAPYEPVTIEFSFTDDADVPTDPTAVIFRIEKPSGTIITLGLADLTDEPGAGEYTYTFTPDLWGHWEYDAVATGNGVTGYASGDFDVDAPEIGASDVENGPCSDWVTPDEVLACCSDTLAGTDASYFEPASVAAGEVLFELSGRLFPGLCYATVRPCGSLGCGMQVLSRGHIVGWGGDGWYGSAYRYCGCSPLAAIDLAGYPVREITEVKIDGAIVDADSYELRDRHWLVRLRDPAAPGTPVAWPGCQSLDLPDTEAGTFSVTYAWGAAVPTTGVLAARELACEIARACDGAEDCALPRGTVQVTRQGVSIDLRAFTAWGRTDGAWQTGLVLVDAFLNSANPAALSGPPLIVSPDSPLFPARMP